MLLLPFQRKGSIIIKFILNSPYKRLYKRFWYNFFKEVTIPSKGEFYGFCFESFYFFGFLRAHPSSLKSGSLSLKNSCQSSFFFAGFWTFGRSIFCFSIFIVVAWSTIFSFAESFSAFAFT